MPLTEEVCTEPVDLTTVMLTVKPKGQHARLQFIKFPTQREAYDYVMLVNGTTDETGEIAYKAENVPNISVRNSDGLGHEVNYLNLNEPAFREARKFLGSRIPNRVAKPKKVFVVEGNEVKLYYNGWYQINVPGGAFYMLKPTGKTVGEFYEFTEWKLLGPDGTELWKANARSGEDPIELLGSVGKE